VAPAEPLQQRHDNLFEDGSTRKSVQASQDNPGNAPQEIMQWTPQDEVLQSDNVLNEELV
jgi:hypothetical protein